MISKEEEESMVSSFGVSGSDGEEWKQAPCDVSAGVRSECDMAMQWARLRWWKKRMRPRGRIVVRMSRTSHRIYYQPPVLDCIPTRPQLSYQ